MDSLVCVQWDGKKMHRINCHVFYLLGEYLAETDAFIRNTLKRPDPVLLSAIKGYFGALKGPLYWITIDDKARNPFPSIVKTAAQRVERILSQIEKEDDYQPTPEDTVPHSEIRMLSDEIRALKTIVTQYIPTFPIFLVSETGGFHPEALLAKNDQEILAEIRDQLPEQCQTDLNDAARCLAFGMPTATVFHMMRAIEEMMKAYHHNLTGMTFEEATPKIQRNWGQYISALDQALDEISASDKTKGRVGKSITSVLYNIKEVHRNPICHPDMNADKDEALQVFRAGIAILGEIGRQLQERHEYPKIEEEKWPFIDKGGGY